MSSGTVRWFNRTIGAGFIRTDDGENVMFLNHAIQGLRPAGDEGGPARQPGYPGEPAWFHGCQCQGP